MKKQNFDIESAALLTRARVSMRSFVINTLLVLLVWLLSFVPGVLFMGALVTGVPGAWFFYLMMCGLALWEMIAVIFFLVPSIAMFWEYKAQK